LCKTRIGTQKAKHLNMFESKKSILAAALPEIKVTSKLMSPQHLRGRKGPWIFSSTSLLRPRMENFG